jgi:hypothetical protein
MSLLSTSLILGSGLDYHRRFGERQQNGKAQQPRSGPILRSHSREVYSDGVAVGAGLFLPLATFASGGF